MTRPARTRTRHRPAHLAVSAVAVLSLTLLGACGQKAGVAGTGAGSGAVGAGVVAEGLGGGVGAGGSLGGGSGSGSLGSGSGSGSLSGGGSGGGAGGGSGSGGSGGSGSSGKGSKGGSGDSGGSSAPGTGTPAGPGDRTGVTDSTIRIGLHAPVTGAAAIPQQSFERAVGVYFDAVNRAGGINGRKVEVLFRDDGFDPNKARTECKRLAEQDEVFLLVGGGGADQIDACARYAASVGVPYISGGVHETRPGLGSLAVDTYFAVTLTYEQQIPLLVRLAKSKDLAGEDVALVVADNDSLNNFYDKAAAALDSGVGDRLVLKRRIPKNTTSDAPSVGTSICSSGAGVVVWNASPSTLLNVSKAMACTVTFVGPGLTNGLNIVADVGCPNLDDALFYSPFPGLDVMRRDNAFVSAYRQKNNAEPDDIGAAIYGLEKLVGAMLVATGKELSRESFQATIAQRKKFETGVFPPTSFDSRFGGTAMHLLRADCGAGEFVTVRQNERP